jgi:acyl transferase domain-containing protein
MASDDVAIVGISFKLPQEAESEPELWKVLQNRKNLMTEWPESRLSLDSFYESGTSHPGRVSLFAF